MRAPGIKIYGVKVENIQLTPKNNSELQVDEYTFVSHSKPQLQVKSNNRNNINIHFFKLRIFSAFPKHLNLETNSKKYRKNDPM